MFDRIFLVNLAQHLETCSRRSDSMAVGVLDQGLTSAYSQYYSQSAMASHVDDVPDSGTCCCHLHTTHSSGAPRARKLFDLVAGEID